MVASAILLASAALISTASAACRGVENVQKIDISLLKGAWYESHSYNLLSLVGPRLCGATYVYPSSDATSFTMLHDYAYYVGDQSQNTRFGWNITDEEEIKDGRLTVQLAQHFSDWMKVTFVVMDTDYTNYAVLYVCKIDGDRYPFNGGMILTRKKLVDEDDEVHKKIAESYKHNRMTKSEFIATPQKDCKDVVFPEVYPDYLSIGKPIDAQKVPAHKKISHIPASAIKQPEPPAPAPAPKPGVNPNESPAAYLQPGSGFPLSGSAAGATQSSGTGTSGRLLSRVIGQLETLSGLAEAPAAAASSAGGPSAQGIPAGPLAGVIVRLASHAGISSTIGQRFNSFSLQPISAGAHPNLNLNSNAIRTQRLVGQMTSSLISTAKFPGIH